MTSTEHTFAPSPPYFEPLLPWQDKAWGQLVGQFYHDKLPHALLAGGMAGIGKRAFVWRFVAWLLCTHKGEMGACGVCESCTWLKADTHPDLLSLPKDDGGVKIDDIRQLQEFCQTTGNRRVVVIDNADKMTLGAGNAFLKTLEEPRAGVYLLLISDNPSKLLPTIKSRVQSLPMAVDKALAEHYVRERVGEQARLLLDLANFAPLLAVSFADAVWLDKRTLWLKTLDALQRGTRTPVQASDYWQGVLSLADFLWLSELMLTELWRVSLGLPRMHSDLDETAFAGLIHQEFTALLEFVMECRVSLGQNVQEKTVYDALFGRLAQSNQIRG